MKKLIAIAVIIGGFAFQAQNALAGNDLIFAEKKPVWGFAPADHTYACIGSYSNCVSTNNNTSGGSFVVSGWGNTAKAQCYASCYMKYASNGVCHQHTNRVLYPTGKTLPVSVRGYVESWYRYGAYGNKRGPYNGKFSFCMSRCANVQ